MLDWQECSTGFEVGRYEIVRDGHLRWQLLVSGRTRSSHATASAAKAEAEKLERIHHRNRRLLRLGVTLGIVVALYVVVFLARLETNPARDEAESLVAELDAAYWAIEGGTASMGDFEGADTRLRGARVALGDDELTVLIGEAGGECYVLYWSPHRSRRARVLGAALPCEATPAIASVGLGSYKRQTPAWSWHLPWIQGSFDWDVILPPAIRQRIWFLPALLLLSAVALTVITRASVILLTGGRSPSGA